MAVIRDVMPAFELFQPTSVADAQKLLEQHGADAWVLAGGMDSFDWLKDRIKRPKVGGRSERHRASSEAFATIADGIEIGAMTTLTEIVNNPIVKQKYRSAGAGVRSWWRRRRSGTRARSAATCRRMRAAGITAPDGRAIARAGTSATPIRRWAAIASTRFCTRSVAWR